MTRTKLLPVGIDIGSTRIRMVQMRVASNGVPSLCAVATRDVPAEEPNAQTIAYPKLLPAILEDLRKELGTKVRRCVISLEPSVAALRVVHFPKMSWLERKQASLLEAERFAPQGNPWLARVHPMPAGDRRYVLGVARRDVLRSRLACLREAGLRPCGVDHHAFALRRAFEHADGIVDLGHAQTTFYAYPESGPLTIHIPGGGVAVTQAIATDLGVKAGVAEKRKRILGTAGAGEYAREDLAQHIADAVGRARRVAPVRRIALYGNSARLAGLAERIETMTEALVETPVSELLRGGAYPDDVIRAAAPDWTLAASLGAWSCAR